MTFYYRYENRVFPISKMFDIDGDETDDPEMAISITVRTGSVWLCAEVDDSDIIRKDNGKSNHY
jgi:hypothetical protein